MSDKDKRRDGNVELLRFLLTTGGLLYALSFSTAAKYTLSSHFHYGYLIYDLFFIITGYFLAYSTEGRKYDAERTGRDTMGLLAGKLRSFMPYYIIGFTAAAAANIITGLKTIPELVNNFSGLLSDLLMLDMSGMGSSNIIPFTWYFSAMMIVCAVCIPFIMRRRDVFLRIVCPAITILFYGYLLKTYFTFDSNDLSGKIINTGLIRAFAGITLGCLTYIFSAKIAARTFGKIGAVFLTVTELALYSYCGYGVVFSQQDGQDPVFVLAFAAAFSITRSGRSYSSRPFDNDLYRYLGSLSVPMAVSFASSVIILFTVLSAAGSPLSRLILNSPTAARAVVLVNTAVLAVINKTAADLVISLHRKLKAKRAAAKSTAEI